MYKGLRLHENLRQATKVLVFFGPVKTKAPFTRTKPANFKAL